MKEKKGMTITKIIKEVTIKNGIEKTILTVFCEKKEICEKLQKKYEKYVQTCSSKSCSFLFEKKQPVKKLVFQPKTKPEASFYKSLLEFFKVERRKCKSSREVDVLHQILQTFLNKVSDRKSWTSLKKFLENELNTV